MKRRAAATGDPPSQQKLLAAESHRETAGDCADEWPSAGAGE